MEGLAKNKISPDKAKFWQEFVTFIPVGTRVFREGEESDVRTTLDGGFYDDALYLYVKVSGRDRKEWRVLEVRKAPDAI
jgi:hypothetical protein